MMVMDGCSSRIQRRSMSRRHAWMIWWCLIQQRIDGEGSMSGIEKRWLFGTGRARVRRRWAGRLSNGTKSRCHVQGRNGMPHRWMVHGCLWREYKNDQMIIFVLVDDCLRCVSSDVSCRSLSFLVIVIQSWLLSSSLIELFPLLSVSLCVCLCFSCSWLDKSVCFFFSLSLSLARLIRELVRSNLDSAGVLLRDWLT